LKFEHDISPVCRGAHAEPIFASFVVWGCPSTNINRMKFQLNGTGG